MKDKPLISILIPAYNRPYYLKLALESALSQTYPNIEIVICDDSTNPDVSDMIQPYLERYSNIKYVKNDTVLYVKNWHKCFDQCDGEYVNYLMDDDLFHPQKMERMIGFLLERTDVMLVTSYRQLIDAYGNARPPVYATRKLFHETKILNGIDLGNDVLIDGYNVIGEPTTVMFRRKDLGEPFGIFRGRQYISINDLATWISLLAKGKAVYLPEPLSYFRIHFGQNQDTVGASSIDDWSELTINAREAGFLQDTDQFRAALTLQMNRLPDVSELPPDSNMYLKVVALKNRIESILNQL